ncbi:MAG: TonB-dependent receptor [Tannerellaceae bacterium]|jgi:iron complex outermembrane receptor protein|nr:TonB-dependent receptor [Tannerellaceae bacterium]
MKKRMFLVSIPLMLSVSVTVRATMPEEVDSMIMLKGVVVSANKVQVNRNSVPLSISVIERSEIEASSESALLPVLSQRVPGLFVTRKGVTGFGVNTNSAGTVNIRGIGQGNKVLMLFDGQPQWAGVFGHSLPDTYVASDVERVEVIRGPGSLLYGSNAMGGVVNIITRRQNYDGRRTQARIMYGSYNTQKYMINNGYNSGKFDSFLSLNYDKSDGMRDNSNFDIVNGFANAGYRLNEHYKLKGDISLAFYENQNPGPVSNPMFENTMDVMRGTTSASLANTHERSSGAIQLFYNWGRHEINDGYRTGGSPRTFLFNSADHNAGVLLYQTFRLVEGNSFTAGLDYKNWGGHAWNDTIQGRRGEIIDRSVNETAGYVIAQQDLFDKLSLNAGLRYEYSDAYGSRLVPQAGVTLRLFEGNAIKAMYSEGYRSPNIRELYISYPPYSIANPDLKPESMQNYELSIGQRIGDKFHAEITGFYLDAKDMIAGVQGKLTNINALHNKGFEVEASYYPMGNLSFTANYSYLDSNIRTEAAPKHKFFLEGSYTISRLTLTADVESVSGLMKVGAATDDADESYTLLNARASYLFGSLEKGLKLFLKGENLAGASYEILSGFPMPKTTVMGGIDIVF